MGKKQCECAGPGHWGAALPTQASDSWCHLHIRAILTLPLDCVITFSLLLISFQIVQERLQAWVSQWTCFLLVNRSNSLEKKIFEENYANGALPSIFGTFIKKTTQLKPYCCSIYVSKIHYLEIIILSKHDSPCLFAIWKWFLICNVVLLLKIYVNEPNKIDIISSQFDMDPWT